MASHIQLDPAYVVEFCKRNQIRKLALFGSVLTDRFRPESDVDILVEFNDEARVGLFELARMEIELTEKLGRKVDLRTPKELSRHFRDEVVRNAEVQYSGE
ncbi:MAG TPA: nucleotidyltransferase domain-containing protein [Thermoanaerobaculia bacterium]|jgi:predicted nucleotidyltransferase|nr:nucleotidyltransferase domain-containing protein [Thermoanaerobaculia bacterium]